MDSIILAGIFLGICQLVGFYCLSLLIRRAINAKQAEIEARAEAALHKWLDPGPDGKPSQFAQVLDVGGSIVGSAAARSIMSSLGAEKSHTARAANGLADEIQGEQNPILGLLAGGKRGKGAAIAKLAQIMGPMLAGAGNNHHSDNAGALSAPPPRKHRET
jgi:hypothetical protein